MDHGKPLESWNFVISFSRPGELWILIMGHGKPLKTREGDVGNCVYGEISLKGWFSLASESKSASDLVKIENRSRKQKRKNQLINAMIFLAPNFVLLRA